jgi:CubicO group peptidase (beta-lactamase class C family)
LKTYPIQLISFAWRINIFALLLKLFELKTKLLLLYIVFFFSCGKNDTKEIEKPFIYNESLPFLKQSTAILPRLSKGYIAQKQQPIKAFCDKYWKDESDNLSFLIARNGQIIHEQYNGIANFETSEALTSKTPLHIASVSKVLTATAILLLIDAKKISLDQKVTTLLDNFPYPKVTIETLLNHRSGLSNYAYFTSDNKVWDKSKILTNQDILTLFTTKKIGLDFPSNTKFNYCNTNYVMLALIIEKVTKTSYKEAMNRMIFKALQMDNTYVFDINKDKETAIASYRPDTSKFEYEFLDGIYGDKNIFSTPRDLLKFDRAINSSSFLNPELVKKIYKGYSYEKDGTKNYGLGIRMIEWPTGQKYYFHNGWWHGNTSSYITLKKEKVMIIALSNKFTRNVYAIRKLAPLFGDYPFEFADEE